MHLKLTGSKAKMQHDVNVEIARLMNAAILKRNIGAVLTTELRLMLGDAIRQQPEYTSLLQGGEDTLKELLGVRDSASKMNALLDAWMTEVDVIFVQFRATGSRIRGGFLITAFEADFSGVLAMEEATQRTKRGDFPWLDWLLLKGDQIIVAGYDAMFDTDFSKSRTGSTLMIKGEGFRVPSEFSGIASHNFITRAVNDNVDEIGSLIYRHIELYLK